MYRLVGMDEDQEMTWQQYGLALLLFSVVGLLAVYALLWLQAQVEIEELWEPGRPLSGGGDIFSTWRLSS